MTQDHTAEFTKGGWYCRGLGPCSCLAVLREVSRHFQGVLSELQIKERKGRWDALRLAVRAPL